MALEVMNLIMRTEVTNGNGDTETSGKEKGEGKKKEEKKANPCSTTFDPMAEKPNVKGVISQIQRAFENRNER